MQAGIASPCLLPLFTVENRLRLDDPSTVGIDYQVLNTVVAAAQLNLATNFTFTGSGSADRPDVATFFANVPAGMPAFKVDLSVTAGRVRLGLVDPRGIPGTPTGFCTAPCTRSLTAAKPMAGVWEVTVETSRASPASPATFGLTAAALGVEIAPDSWVQDPATIGTTYTQTFTFTNKGASFTGNATGTAFGSAFAARPTIAAGGPDQVYEIDVPAGTTRVSARISNPSVVSADLDLYLFDCTAGPASCVLKAASESAITEEFVAADNPAAGLWKAVVVVFSLAVSSTQYDYLDLITKPGFGSVTVADPPAVHPHGDTWTRTASATANAAPAAGRFLQGFVEVRSSGTLLGSAEVDFMHVGP